MSHVSNKTRINLHVSAIDEDGKGVYFVRHLGFFPPDAVQAIVDNLDIRHLAFNSGVERQTGHVSIATCHFTGEDAGPEDLYVRFANYEPPKPREPLDPCLVKREPDEPMFVLLARDPVAPAVMEHWCLYRTSEIIRHQRPDTPEERQHIQAVREKAQEFREWRCANRE